MCFICIHDGSMFRLAIYLCADTCWQYIEGVNCVNNQIICTTIKLVCKYFRKHVIFKII